MSERDPVPPDLLGIGRVDPTVPGQPWWRYRRAELPDVPARLELQGHDGPGERLDPADAPAGDGQGADDEPERATPIEVMLAEKRSPLPFVLLGFLLLICLYFASRGGNMTSAGSLVVPIVGLLFASGAAIWQTRRHPDEPFLLRWLVLAFVAKLVASYLRYITLVVGYEGKNRAGDATRYHETGHELALWWLHKGPDPNLPNYRRTNFVYWFDGVVQTIVGNDFLAGFFVFGLLAVAGSYMWYRAAADVVPILDKRLYFLFIMFAPSIVFWPSSVGKEALMQLGIGALSLGLARLVQRRIFAGLLICAPAGWLVWVVRPHLLAIVAVAGGFAYLMGRVKSSRGGMLLSRPLGIIVIAILVGFTVSQGAEYLGLEDFSLNSIEQTLDEQTERTSQGGSKFDPGDNSLNPIDLPARLTTVLVRPFPWEVENSFQLLASLESMLLVALIVARFSSVRASLRNARRMPFLLYGWLLVLLYCAAYAAFANFGLLVRQRSLVFPALLLLLAVDPVLAARAERRAMEEAEAAARGLALPADASARG